MNYTLGNIYKIKNTFYIEVLFSSNTYLNNDNIIQSSLMSLKNNKLRFFNKEETLDDNDLENIKLLEKEPKKLWDFFKQHPTFKKIITSTLAGLIISSTLSPLKANDSINIHNFNQTKIVYDVSESFNTNIKDNILFSNSDYKLGQELQILFLNDYKIPFDEKELDKLFIDFSKLVKTTPNDLIKDNSVEEIFSKMKQLYYSSKLDINSYGKKDNTLNIDNLLDKNFTEEMIIETFKISLLEKNYMNTNTNINMEHFLNKIKEINNLNNKSNLELFKHFKDFQTFENMLDIYEKETQENLFISSYLFNFDNEVKSATNKIKNDLNLTQEEIINKIKLKFKEAPFFYLNENNFDRIITNEIIKEEKVNLFNEHKEEFKTTIKEIFNEGLNKYNQHNNSNMTNNNVILEFIENNDIYGASVDVDINNTSIIEETIKENPNNLFLLNKSSDKDIKLNNGYLELKVPIQLIVSVYLENKKGNIDFVNAFKNDMYNVISHEASHLDPKIKANEIEAQAQEIYLTKNDGGYGKFKKELVRSNHKSNFFKGKMSDLSSIVNDQQFLNNYNLSSNNLLTDKFQSYVKNLNSSFFDNHNNVRTEMDKTRMVVAQKNGFVPNSEYIENILGTSFVDNQIQSKYNLDQKSFNLLERTSFVPGGYVKNIIKDMIEKGFSKDETLEVTKLLVLPEILDSLYSLDFSGEEKGEEIKNEVETSIINNTNKFVDVVYKQLKVNNKSNKFKQNI